MAAKPLTTEAIALTEKKMDMALDDIIKLSKNPATKGKKQQRVANKNPRTYNNAFQQKALKVQQYMGSRSSLRQGVLVQRRSNFQGNHFPLTNEAARKAAANPVRNRAFNVGASASKMNRARPGALPFQRRSAIGGFAGKSQQQINAMPNQRPQTLDSLFANMKEQRMRVVSRPNVGFQQRNGGGRRPRVPWARGPIRN